MNWLRFSAETALLIPLGRLVIIARPDGKSWSGILTERTPQGVHLVNRNTSTYIGFGANPTASIQDLSIPKWNVRLGDPKLPLE